MAELLAGLSGTSFAARVSVDNPKNLMRAKKLLRKAFETQMESRGFSFVEFLSACPTNWKMTPQQANQRIKEEMIPCFPLGLFKGDS